MLFEFIIFSIILGITIGLTPGPIFILVISESLEKGKLKGGFQVILGMLITDILIIIPLALFTVIFFYESTIFFYLGLLGGLFIIFFSLSRRK